MRGLPYQTPLPFTSQTIITTLTTLTVLTIGNDLGKLVHVAPM